MICWAVKSGRVILPYTIRLTRKDAILAYRRLDGQKIDKGRGESVVKVEVRELDAERPSLQ